VEEDNPKEDSEEGSEEGSGEDEPYDCSKEWHAYSPTDKTDNSNLDPSKKTELWLECDKQPCPFRYNKSITRDYIWPDFTYKPVQKNDFETKKPVPPPSESIPSTSRLFSPSSTTATLVPNTPITQTQPLPLPSLPKAFADFKPIAPQEPLTAFPLTISHTTPIPLPTITKPKASMDVDNDLKTALASLVKQQELLGKYVQALGESQKLSSTKSGISRPEPFKGVASDARRFVQHFTIWARSQGSPFNSAQSTPNVEIWISSFLSLLAGPAAIWATPYMQAIEEHHRDSTKPFPFETNWDKFITSFTSRFQGVNDALLARKELQEFKQGRLTAQEYASRFAEIAARAGFSEMDNMTRFMDGLNDNTRNLINLAIALSPDTNKPDTLEKLTSVTIDLAFKMGTLYRLPSGSSGGGSKNLSMGEPMDISAGTSRTPSGRTREQFTKKMKGKCYGCGSSAHIKRDGNHAGVKCDYCQRPGHFSTVCQDKFLGHACNRGLNPPPFHRQRVAANTDTPFTLFPEEGPPSFTTIAATTATAPAPAATSDLTSLQALMAEQNRNLQALLQGGSGF